MLICARLLAIVQRRAVHENQSLLWYADDADDDDANAIVVKQKLWLAADVLRYSTVQHSSEALGDWQSL